MDPIKTAASNFVYRGPAEDIGDLWVQRVRVGEIRAVFDLTDQERALIAKGGRIELALFSEPIPPVSLIVLPEEQSRPVGDHPFRIDHDNEIGA